MAWYMVKPAQMLTARDKKAVIFVGSAQSGKTQSLILNWLAYTVTVDPMDMIIYSPTKGAARDFSMRRVDRMHRDSPEVGKHILKQRDADNKFDKLYDSGIMLTLSHPSVTELAGRPIPRVALTDYDRMDDDIGGDGSPFDLASKRTTTFGSFAMTLAESSPSKPITDPKYIPKTKHEAPPANGILALYNRGDRQRRYWQCPKCDDWFEPNFRMFVWDRTKPTKVEQAETVMLACPHCGHKIPPTMRNELDMFGEWLEDGQWIDKNGKIHGPSSRNPIASFWLNGVISSFISWKDLVINYLTAEEAYERTGSEEELKKFYNTDLGEPYLPKVLESERRPEVLRARAEPFPVRQVDEDEDRLITRHYGGKYDAVAPLVPAGVRFLVATIDVQANAFVVCVWGVMPGLPFDTLLLDRFHIMKSHRTDHNGEHLWVKPGAYLEDWDRITEEVIERSYPLADGSGRRMMIKLAGCDSGGREGVTTNAYNYYRKIRAEGFAGRFHLLKGDPTPNAPRTRISYPDSNRRDRFAAARGDVPVLMIGSNTMKDTLAHRLECIEPGKGMIRLPEWMADFVFSELCVEVRTPKGWDNPGQRRNETWDLGYYALALCVSPLLTVEQIDWDNPPGWAAEWDDNILVTAPNQKQRYDRDENPFDFSKLAENLA